VQSGSLQIAAFGLYAGFVQLQVRLGFAQLVVLAAE